MIALGRGSSAAAHREAVPLAEGDAGTHAEAASIIEAIRDHGNSVRRTRPDTDGR